MEIPNTLEELTDLFRRLGAPRPEHWARSQVKEGIPQVHRYLWLREAWKSIVPDESYEWMDAEIETAHAKPNSPYSGIGLAIERCQTKGIEKEDLKEIVRGKQAQLLFALCYLLDDPNFSESELKGVSRSLFQTDENGKPVAPISGLHQSVLGTDPTGREMRPEKTLKHGQ